MSDTDRQLVQQFLEATEHLGLREAAALIDKSHQTVARWRKGNVQRITNDTRRAVERALASRELAESRAEAGKARPLFVVSNHHVEGSGTPPFIDGDSPDTYHSYFENAYGEQAVFIYDYDKDEGVLRIGDAGWEIEYPVVDGFAEVTLNQPEALWLVAAWAAAKRLRPREVMEVRDKRARARAEELTAYLEEKMEELGGDKEQVHRLLQQHFAIE